MEYALRPIIVHTNITRISVLILVVMEYALRHIVINNKNDKKHGLNPCCNGFSKKEDNIDFFFIANAFETIEGWFEKKQKNGEDLLGICINFYQQLNDNVKVIWYELEENISGVELFTRLNIGRIPLTNSELVRALFLSRNSGLTNGRQLEIAAEWNNIEKELHSPTFWAFLANYNPKEYPNRIELLFDMMAGGRKTKDKYATFFFFNQRINEQRNKIDVWNSIIAFYEQLKEWYESRVLFHKVGYLVALNQENLRRLLNETKEMRKSEVSSYIDCKIKESLKGIESLESLNYHDNYQDTHNVLPLFNIISIMKNTCTKPRRMELGFHYRPIGERR